ncbi:MAG: hypothetical protein WBM29_12785 [Candidatus Deferrimicrobium sp.]
MTSEFLHEAHVQRAALGMEGLNPVVILHPLSTLTEEEIQGRAKEALSLVVATWLGK